MYSVPLFYLLAVAQASDFVYNIHMNRIYISARADRALTEYLADSGYEVWMLPRIPGPDPAIADHPDLVFCSLGPGRPVFHGKIAAVGRPYPADVPYNACCTGKYFIHNLKYTHAELLAAAEDAGMIPVNVPQGYSRCSCLPITEDAVITADQGIIQACRDAGLTVLEVTPGHVELPGYKYGFIGGCAGRVGDTVVFHGSLAGHPDGAQIRSFIEERGLKCIDFPEFPLRDIGSVIEECVL